MNEQFLKRLKALPKAELHVHIEGTLEISLAKKLALRNKLDLGRQPNAVFEKYYAFTDLPSFLGCYYTMMDVLRCREDFFDLAYSYFSRVSKDNVVYAEVFFDPQAHMNRGIAFSEVILGLHQAQQKAKSDFGIESQLIMCFLRDHSESEAFEVYEEALAYKDLFVGVGLDSDGFENPPIKFVNIFKRAREDGFKLTMHAEYDQKDIHQHIFDCLYKIGVDRIDHGVNAADDPELVKALVEKGVGLTVCPLSTLSINGSKTLQEIRVLLDGNVKVTINSDDPAYFGGYVNDNLVAVAQSGMFSEEEILQMVQNAFDMAWIS